MRYTKELVIGITAVATIICFVWGVFALFCYSRIVWEGAWRHLDHAKKTLFFWSGELAGHQKVQEPAETEKP